ncbi:MAG: thioredoxin family protein [Flavobacteriales bacterium]|jgi:thiol-disulfide isomerase/thioredoxin|uniref:thioredoxin family protein n=1 Tax=Blattabacterium sp. (Mastotermes darwiniensis) TaxID=39768 RepID=UPI000231DDCA|nr:thioredoxin family protein [Blattabacterium sp. (Mastotermes darwiniensis)]AER40510.1 Thioredoxin [Blattabacterium sp. (Mastotermes darwiniensis) str. MADAR]MDR1804975.1 thioredoxin family protein [Flavobacteriales bacterium]
MVVTHSSNEIRKIKIKNFELLESISRKNKFLKNFFSDKATVIMFICNHCPYVKHINPELVRLTKEYIPKGVSFLAINSNDIEKYPEDSPEEMKKISHQLGYPFPYFFDEKQEVAKYYGAKCTPEFFIFNGLGNLCYHGQLDDSRPGNGIPVTGNDVREILQDILEGIEKITYPKIKPSYGCNIKWKV